MAGLRVFGYPSGNKRRGLVAAFLLSGIFCTAANAGDTAPAEQRDTPMQLTAEHYRIQARIDQLGTELNGEQAIGFDPELLEAASSDPHVAAMLKERQTQFERRWVERQQKQASLHERIQAAEAAIERQQQQLSSNRRRLTMINGKLQSLQPAIEKGLIGENYVSALNAEVAQLAGVCDELEANIGRIKQTVAEYALEQSHQELTRRRIVQMELDALNDRLQALTSRPTGSLEAALASGTPHAINHSSSAKAAISGRTSAR